MRLHIDLTEGKVEKNVFFTSDWHLFHTNVLRFDNRPFDNLNEMHKAIINNWNDIVTDDDIVIYLGDLSFARSKERGDVESMVWGLNGEIHYVIGNHDKFDDIQKIGKFKSVQDYLEVKITHMYDKGHNIIEKTESMFCCMHYPIYSWNKKHHGAFMVHGHTHGNLHHGEDASFYTDRRVIDVGCMLHDYKPVGFNEVISKLSHVDYNIKNNEKKNSRHHE